MSDVRVSGELTGKMTIFEPRSGSRNPRKSLIVQSVDRGWSREHNKLVDVYRTFDRQNDEYYKRIEDPVSHEMLWAVRHPLSEHWGHGSAKPKTPRGPLGVALETERK